MNKLQKYSPTELAYLKALFEGSFYDFARFAFQSRAGINFVQGRHHKLICDTLERVFRGEITRLIINIPPGYTKTELAVVLFISWCLAKTPHARFIHTSANDNLVLENSTYTKYTGLSDGYQTLWHLRLRDESRTKQNRWVDRFEGGRLAVRTAGCVCGYLAGSWRMGSLRGA